MALDFQSAFGLHESALGVRSQRMQLLSSNLANADTPGYKARDVNFQAAMAAASSDLGGMDMSRTQSAHLPGVSSPAPVGVVQYRVPTQPSLDGNTVDAQQEQAAFARNSLDYQASLTFLNNAIKNMMTALRGS